MRKIGACLVLIAALIGVNAATAAGATDAGQAAGRGLEIGVPVYRFHGDPYLTELESAAMTPVPPSVVILNIDNGDSDVSQLDADADALRARVGGNGEHVKVIGYVHTDFATRSIADVERSVDRWLSPRDGGVHYDGIFFDQVTRDCGPAADSTAYRDYYRALREYVWDKIPASSDLVVDNVGSAVSDCYLAPGRDTADTFVTFEGSQVDYADNWVGGNIIADGGYSLGEAYPSWRFWHIIYSAGSADYKTVLSDSFNRYAGMATVTDAALAGSQNDDPHYLNQAIRYAGTLGLVSRKERAGWLRWRP